MHDAPFYGVAVGHKGGEGEDKDVLHGIADKGVSFLIEFVHEVHTFLHHFKVVFEGHSFGVVCQYLDGLVGAGRGVRLCELELDFG